MEDFVEKVEKISLGKEIWFKEDEFVIDFPQDWDVSVHHMQGYKSSVLNKEEIRRKIDNPVSTGTLQEEAKGAESAVILFDDTTRPTKAYRIAPYILQRILKAGVPKSSIRFVMAQGAHRAASRLEYGKKLGKKIVDNYPIFSHNPFHNCVRLGTTSYGTPVEINAEVMNCDLKVGIGAIIPHPQAGFGGGGKIILPGVSSIETIRKNHHLSYAPGRELRENAGWGCYTSNDHRLDVEEATKMAGLDFKVDGLFNYKGQLVDIFAGDPIEEHHAGVSKAKNHYETKLAVNKDVVVANAYCKASEAGLAIEQGVNSLKSSGGKYVLITNTPEGLAPHYLYGRWGLARIGGYDWSERTTLPDNINDLIVLTKFIDRGNSWYLGPRDKINWIKEWSYVKEILGKNKELKVALYPDATIQLIKEVIK